MLFLRNLPPTNWSVLLAWQKCDFLPVVLNSVYFQRFQNNFVNLICNEIIKSGHYEEHQARIRFVINQNTLGELNCHIFKISRPCNGIFCCQLTANMLLSSHRQNSKDKIKQQLHYQMVIFKFNVSKFLLPKY